MTDVGADAGTDVESAHPWAVQVGVLVVVGIALLDQVTKSIAEAVLAPGRFVPWLGSGVGWQLVYNPGGAFGVPAPSWIFLVVTVVVIVLVAKALPRTALLTAACAYGLLLGGAIGNVLDRLLRDGDGAFGGGYVVDFVAWGSFPRFNVADSAITVGFVLLVVAMLIDERRARVADEQTPEAPEVAEAAPVDDGPGQPPVPGDAPAEGAGPDDDEVRMPDGHEPGMR
ncbi:MAG: signal peptidase II [Nitriliruptoraceae bacterium]|nr:signal peptidase II [Nitriliruptoraceae bacterium]